MARLSEGGYRVCCRLLAGLTAVFPVTILGVSDVSGFQVDGVNAVIASGAIGFP